MGASLVAAPFLGQLSGLGLGRVRAAEDGCAKRLILFFSPNGTVHRHWRPTGGERDFAFAPGTILEPLDAFRSDLIVVDGLDFYGGTNHEGGMREMLRGGSVESIDQHIANGLQERNPTRFRFP